MDLLALSQAAWIRRPGAQGRGAGPGPGKVHLRFGVVRSRAPPPAGSDRAKSGRTALSLKAPRPLDGVIDPLRTYGRTSGRSMSRSVRAAPGATLVVSGT